MLSDRAARALNRGTTCGVVALAVAGFAMSYDALHALAVDQGVPAALAWLWPLVVDGFIVVASLCVVRAVAEDRRAAYPRVLVLAFSGISVAFNVVHAAPTLVARLVAAIPPAALVLSFELLMRQLRAALRPLDDAIPIAKPHLVVAPTAIAPEPQPELPTSSPRSPLLERARDIYTVHRRANQPVTGAVLARELGISDGYGRRLLRQLATDGGGTA
jgi:hypothetical protein